jgi:hypothetical protein
MNRYKYIFLLLILGISAGRSYAQPKQFHYLFQNKQAELSTADLRFYGGFLHQHQNFFHKAFSFQGAEAGIIIKHKLILGVYGSAFVSDLKIEMADSPLYLLMNQAGLMGGYIHRDNKILHTGFLLNLGYFCLAGDSKKIPVFKQSGHEISLDGLVIAPQLFAEVNLLRWLKFRTGIGYSFYDLGNTEKVKRANLENFSFNFGFLVGKYN